MRGGLPCLDDTSDAYRLLRDSLCGWPASCSSCRADVSGRLRPALRSFGIPIAEPKPGLRCDEAAARKLEASATWEGAEGLATEEGAGLHKVEALALQHPLDIEVVGKQRPDLLHGFDQRTHARMGQDDLATGHRDLFDAAAIAEHQHGGVAGFRDQLGRWKAQIVDHLFRRGAAIDDAQSSPRCALMV